MSQMSQKITIYGELIKLLRKEWESISNYSYEAIQEILNKKETLVLKIQVLEENRAEVVDVIAKKLGMLPEELTLKKLIVLIDHPVKAKLMKYRITLLEQIKTIAELNEINQGLVDTSSLSIKKSLAFIHKTQSDAEAGYHGDGQMNGNKTSSCMLSLEA
jgi:flagellar biosynthesis/type III secretory pathway chaperone